MPPPPTGGRDFILPASTLTAIRRAATELGADDAVCEALRRAGREAGAALAPLAREAGGRGVEAFWEQVSRQFRARGWGTVVHRRIHPAIAILESSDAVEAAVGEGEAIPSGCPLTTGLLEGLLQEAAGRPVPLVQVACRTRGDRACLWVWGAPAALERLQERLQAGDSLEAAVEGL